MTETEHKRIYADALCKQTPRSFETSIDEEINCADCLKIIIQELHDTIEVRSSEYNEVLKNLEDMGLTISQSNRIVPHKQPC